MKERLQSWALWLALAALAVFVVMNITGLDISEPVNAIMALLLPVLVAFGVINDPTVHDKLFSASGQKWYESWAVWLALAALITYCVRLFTGFDAGPLVDSLMNVLLPVMVAFGIVNNPTSANTI